MAHTRGAVAFFPTRPGGPASDSEAETGEAVVPAVTLAAVRGALTLAVELGAITRTSTKVTAPHVRCKHTEMISTRSLPVLMARSSFYEVLD